MYNIYQHDEHEPEPNKTTARHGFDASRYGGFLHDVQETTA